MKKLNTLLPVLLAITFGVAVLPLGAAEAETATAPPDLGPKMVLEDWEWIQRDLARDIEKSLNADVPRYQEGDPIEFSLLGGVTEKGAYEWASTNYVLIVTGNKAERKIEFNKLAFEDRLKCDTAIRNELISLEAASQTRSTLIENGVEIPGMPPMKNGRRVKERIDYSKKPEPLENFEELLYYADPRALYEMGTRFLKGEGVPQDPTFAFLYFREAASNGDAFAMFNLGMQYFKGLGTKANRPAALQLVSAASDKGHRGAKEFLKKYKVSTEQKRKAQEEYAKKLESYNKRAIANADRYAKMLAAQPTLQQNRTNSKLGEVIRRTGVNKNRYNPNRRR